MWRWFASFICTFFLRCAQKPFCNMQSPKSAMFAVFIFLWAKVCRCCSFRIRPIFSQCVLPHSTKLNTSNTRFYTNFLCVCVFLLILHELNLLPQAMNNFIRDDKPFERNDCSLLFAFRFVLSALILLRFAHSPTQYFSNNFSFVGCLDGWLLCVCVLMFFSSSSIFRNLLLNSVWLRQKQWINFKQRFHIFSLYWV